MIALYSDLEFHRDLIRRKALRLQRLSRLRSQDREDLEQDLVVDLIGRWKRFDPRRGTPRAFASVVVDRRASNRLRDRDSPSRRPPPQEPVDPDLLPDHSQRTPEELLALKLDVNAAVATLPPVERTLAQRLKVDTLSEVARQMNVPRTTLGSYVRRIRQRFEAAGLRRYL